MPTKNAKMPRNCTSCRLSSFNPNINLIFSLNSRTRSTKGIGRTAPTKWQDAGQALNHPELEGCEMPAGKGEDLKLGNDVYLQYNEVGGFLLCGVTIREEYD